MRAEIRHLLTPDIDPDTFVPDDPERFSFLVQMLAGPLSEEGEESFQFNVCTPGWLSAHYSFIDTGTPSGPRTIGSSPPVAACSWCAAWFCSTSVGIGGSGAFSTGSGTFSTIV